MINSCYQTPLNISAQPQTSRPWLPSTPPKRSGEQCLLGSVSEAAGAYGILAYGVSGVSYGAAQHVTSSAVAEAPSFSQILEIGLSAYHDHSWLHQSFEPVALPGYVAKLYTFPPVKILPLVLNKIREDHHCSELAEPALVSGPERTADNPPGRFPSGGICCHKRVARYGIPAWIFGIFMLGCSRGDE